MIKKEELNGFAKDFIKERLDENIKQLHKRHDIDEKRIEKEFMQVLSNVFQKCIQMQLEGKRKL